MLLPTGHSVLRQTLDRWFNEQGVYPNVVGEFEDSALMSVFAARGLGVFPLSRLGGGDIGVLRGLLPPGPARRRRTRKSTRSETAAGSIIRSCRRCSRMRRLRFFLNVCHTRLGFRK